MYKTSDYDYDFFHANKEKMENNLWARFLRILDSTFFPFRNVNANHVFSLHALRLWMLRLWTCACHRFCTRFRFVTQCQWLRASHWMARAKKIYPSIHPSILVHLSYIHLFDSICISLIDGIYASIYPSIHQSTHQSIYLSIQSSVCRFIYPFVIFRCNHLCIYIYIFTLVPIFMFMYPWDVNAPFLCPEILVECGRFCACFLQ